MRQLSPFIALACLWTVNAGAAAVEVQNVADPTKHPYEQTASNLACSFAGDCSIVFPAITTERTLILRASCFFVLATGASVVKASLTDQDVGGSNFLPVITYGQSDENTNFGINEATYLFFDKGGQPRMDVVSTGAPVKALSCTLSGYYL